MINSSFSFFSSSLVVISLKLGSHGVVFPKVCSVVLSGSFSIEYYNEQYLLICVYIFWGLENGSLRFLYVVFWGEKSI